MSVARELADLVSASPSTDPNFDNGTLVVDSSTNRVGVGTTVPAVALHSVGSLNVGVDNTGHDVKFFGATTGAFALWDESVDKLELRGGNVTPGTLLLSTAEPSVVDGNKLGQIDFSSPADGSGTDDSIKVAASIWAEADATFSATVNDTDLVFATGLSEVATEKVRITSIGNVGIGSTAPGNPLRVVQQANGAPAVSIRSEQADPTSSLVFTTAEGSVDWYMGKNLQGVDAGDIFGIATGANAALRMSITNAGNVGINTTAPSAPLEVEKDQNAATYVVVDNNTSGTGAMAGFRGDADAANFRLRVYSSAYSTSSFNIADSVGLHSFDASGGLALVSDHSTADMSFWTNSTQKMTIDGASGNVGIGVTDPAAKLELYPGGAIRFRGPHGGYGEWTVDTGNTVTQRTYLRSKTNDGSLKTVFSASLTAQDTRIMGFGRDITSLNTLAGSDLYISSGGNIGIGTIAPDGRCHVFAGSAGSVTPHASGDDLVVEKDGAGGISILTPDNSNAALFFGSPTDNLGALMQWNHDGDELTIATHNAGAKIVLGTAVNVAAMTIDSSGNVGIGDAPASKLDVRGTVQVGVNGTGHDVKFFGDTATTGYLLWDEDTDDLILGPVSQLGVGVTAPDTIIHARSSQPGLTLQGYATSDTTSPYLKLQKSKNATLGTNTAVTAGQVIGDIDFAGANGSAFGNGIRIRGIADETFSGTAAGAALTFLTCDNTTTSLDERMRIDHNGSIGIGTTNPGARLHVKGTNATIYVDRAATNELAGIGFMTNGAETNGSWAIRMNHAQGTDTTPDLSFHKFTGTDAEIMRLTDAGFVGIGTINPGALLHPYGASSTTGAARFLVDIEDSTSYAQGVGGGIRFSGKYHSDGSSATLAGIWAYKENANSGNYGGQLHLGSRTNGGAMTSDIIINSSGYLGINVDPTKHFDCNGDSFLRGVVFVGAATAGDDSPRMVINHAANAQAGLHIQNSVTASGAYMLKVHNSGNNGIIVDSGGGLAVTGTTSTKNITMDRGAISSTNQIYWKTGTSEQEGNIHMGFLDANNADWSVDSWYGPDAEIFRFQANGGHTYTHDGGVHSLSDLRVKKEITDISEGLEIVNQLRPVNFKYNGQTKMGPDDGVVQVGFIADEIQAVAPYYVDEISEKLGATLKNYEEGDEIPEGKEIGDRSHVWEGGEVVDDFKTISTTHFIPMMVKAIQELSAKNVALEAKVTVLENA